MPPDKISIAPRADGEEKLHPCYFCKHEVICERRGWKLIRFAVTCDSCYAQGPETIDRQDAIRLWNAVGDKL